MKRVLGFCQFFYRSVWWIAVSAIILVGVVVAIARLGLPLVADYRAEVEQRLQQELGVSLSIGAVEADWHGLYPQLRVQQLALYDDQGEPTGVRFEQMHITLDVWASLRHWQLQPADLELSGSRFEVIRDLDGRIGLRGWASRGGFNWDRTLAWVLQHRLIRISDARAEVEDIGSGVRFDIAGADIYLLNIGNGHRLTASAWLVDSDAAVAGSRVAARLTASADMVGGDSRLGQGGFYLAVQELVLHQPQVAWLPTIEGANLRLWAHRDSLGWASLEGELRDLRLLGERGSEPLPLEDSAFRSRRGKQGWSIVAGPITELVPDDDTRVWLDWTPDSSGQPAIEVKVDRVDADTLAALLRANSLVPDPLRVALTAAEPQGDLRAVTFSKAAGQSDFVFTTRFNGLSSQYWKGVPRLQDISGGMSLESASGRVTLQAGGGRIAMPKLFADSWQLDQLKADLNLALTDDETQVQLQRVLLETPDLAVEVLGGIRAPRPTGAPTLDLVIAFYRANGEELRRYLPLVGLSEKVRRWLADAIVAGKVTGGGAVFRGRVDQFPFDAAEGQFEVGFDIVDAIVDYAHNWPRLEGTDAEVQFHQQDMQLYAVGGHILDAEMRQVHVSLPGLRRPGRTVHLDGELDLGVDEVRAFILDSPLAEKYAPFVDSLVAQGNGSLRIKLDLPLGKPKETRVSGVLNMRGTDLHWERSGLLLGKVHGDLGFDANGLTGKDLRAVVMGRPARIDVGPGQDRGQPATFIKLSGQIDKGLLRNTLGKAWAAQFSGSSRWQARISLPKNPKGKLHPQVTFESDLKGLAIDLPDPAGKPAGEAVKFRIGTELGVPQRRSIWFGYGERLGGIVEMDLIKDRLLRGELRFGRSIASLPESDKLLVRGDLKTLSVDQWMQMFARTSSDGKASQDVGQAWLERLGDIRLKVKRLNLLGQRYSDLSIRANQQSRQWVVDLDGDEIKGSLVFPNDHSKPLFMDMDRFYVVPLGGKRGSQPPDPRKLPPMNIKVRDFHFDGLELGSLDLVARRQSYGLELKKLAIKSPLLEVTASGSWQTRKGRHHSNFDIDFNADSLGEMFFELGYANTIKGGSTTGHISANWAGSPTQFALGRLNGAFSIEIGSGSLLQFDPGAGRIFGLLSPQVFTHTLGERYQELSKKGFYFEKISADYRLEGGNAYTDKLSVSGPVARIEMSGRIGLLARDYNQYVEVIPRVSSSLTLASGALAIGNPPLGAALLLAQTVFGETLDTISARYYLISGSWDKPQVTRLQRSRQ